MPTVVLLARLLLTVLFAGAGLAKLMDPRAVRRTVIDFGVPRRMAWPVTVGLPFIELGTASALLSDSLAFKGALSAIAPLCLFSGAAAYSLTRGRAPDCNCFGQWHSAPVGPKTFVRNGLFSALAAIVLWRSWQGNTGPDIPSLLANLSAVAMLGTVVALLVVPTLAVLGWFVFHLLRQQARFLTRLQLLEATISSASAAGNDPSTDFGLPIGTTAPTFRLPDLDGNSQTLETLRRPDSPALVLFVDPACESCTALLSEVGRWQREYADRLSIIVVSRGDRAANLTRTSQHGLASILLQSDREVADAYRSPGTPSAVLIDAVGRIASPVAAGPDAISRLAAEAAEPRVASHVMVGQHVPPLIVHDLAGRRIPLSIFKGNDLLLLFWNPRCAFCQQMIADLQDWDRQQPDGPPTLVLISSGPSEMDREMGLSVPVLQDPTGKAARVFGIRGVPSAVLVGADSRVASEPAAGALAIWALLRQSLLDHRMPVDATLKYSTGPSAPGSAQMTTSIVARETVLETVRRRGRR